MADFYKDLDMIRRRPGMYLGKISATHMRIFLDGYRYALDEQGGVKSLEPLPYFLFHTFVSHKYKESACMGWNGIVLKQAGNDEEKALNLFFELMDMYRSISVVKCQMADLSSENQEYYKAAATVRQCINLAENIFVPKYLGALRIFIIELSEQNGYLLAVEYEDAICISSKYFCWDKKILLKHTEVNFGKLEWKACSKELLYEKTIYETRNILDLEGNKVYWGNI